MLIIELDGGVHLEKNQTEYDRERDEILKRLGYTVRRLPNTSVSELALRRMVEEMITP